MAGKKEKGGGRGVVIIKKIDEGDGGGGHGGAWKVAYADFVTAMMAFFLLMWLLNATTEDQRKGLADYFSPNNLMSHASSGTGEPFGGHTAFDEGALVSDRGSVEITEGKRPPLASTEDGDPQVFTQARKPAEEKPVTASNPGADPSITDPSPIGRGAHPVGPASDGSREPTQAEIQAEREHQEKMAFEKAAEQIRDAVRNDPALAELAKQLAIDMTPEGLRIQIMDEVKLPMFASGSAVPNDRARELLSKVAPFLQKLPESISIAGYTDATPYAGSGKTNWELSSERANATRRLLTDSGLTDTRILTVTGHADRDPLLPEDPLAAANRRIAIVVLREARAPQPAEKAMPAAEQASRPADKAMPAQDRPVPSGARVSPGTDRPPPPADKAAPVVDRPLPPTDKAAPVMDRPTPPSGKVAPAADRPTPPADKTAPALDRPIPPLGKATPAADRPAPTADKAVPAADRLMPPGGKATSAAVTPAPAADKAARAAIKIAQSPDPAG